MINLVIWWIWFYLYGNQIVENSSSPHHITLQNGITDEKKNTILFFFHQQNIHDEQKMRI